MDTIRSLRVEFLYDNDSTWISNIKKLTILPPKSELFNLDQDYLGYILDLVDDEGKILYRIPIADPFDSDVEVHSPTSSEKIYLVSSEIEQGSFSQIIPYTETVCNLVISYYDSNVEKSSLETYSFEIDPDNIYDLENMLDLESNNNGYIVNNPVLVYGDSSTLDTWNLVMLAEGYTDGDEDMQKFQNDVSNFIDGLKNN